jgi:hypothetical protein
MATTCPSRLLGELRTEVAVVCRQLTAASLVTGTSDNVSARDGDLVAVTPSGLGDAALTAGLVGVPRLDGSPVEARRGAVDRDRGPFGGEGRRAQRVRGHRRAPVHPVPCRNSSIAADLAFHAR